MIGHRATAWGKHALLCDVDSNYDYLQVPLDILSDQALDGVAFENQGLELCFVVAVVECGWHHLSEKALFTYLDGAYQFVEQLIEYRDLEVALASRGGYQAEAQSEQPDRGPVNILNNCVIHSRVEWCGGCRFMGT